MSVEAVYRPKVTVTFVFPEAIADRVRVAQPVPIEGSRGFEAESTRATRSSPIFA